MQQPPILSIKMVPAGVDLVVSALSRLPYDQVAGLIAEIRGQAQYQLAEQTQAAEQSPQPEGDPE